MGTRRRVSREYKQEAVALATQHGVAVAQAARNLGLSVKVLRRWVQEFRTDPQYTFPGEGQQKARNVTGGEVPVGFPRLSGHRV